MSTHINASKGQIAETVLLPGDPLRAKYIAETFLENVELYNTVRNMFGYTGWTKDGQKVSVQGTGMGIPSSMIYVEELINEFEVKNLIRVGSIGAMKEDINVRDIIIAQGAVTDSSVVANTFGGQVNFSTLADFNLLEKAVHSARARNLPVHVGNVLSSDRFYNEELDKMKLAKYGVLGVEMEAAGLYLLGHKYDVKTLAICTVSDHIITGIETDSLEREQSFGDMVEVALDVVKSL